MAVSWLDGFDSGDLTRYTIAGSTASATAIGSRAGKQVRLTASGGSIALAFTARTELSLGFRLYVTVAGGITITDFGSADVPKLTVNATQTGIEVTHKKGSSSLQTFAAGAITPSTWAYVELAYLHSASGYVTVKVNGVTTYSYSGTTFSNSGTPTSVSSWTAFSQSSATNYYIDDLYIGDGQLLGPVTISSLVPTSDKSATWTGSTGGSHYLLVDDQPASMTDYVYATAGSALTETYGLTPPAGMGTIPAIQVNAVGLSSDGGAANVTLFADGQAGSSTALGASATTVSQVYATAASSAPWTGTNLGTAAFGIRSS